MRAFILLLLVMSCSSLKEGDQSGDGVLDKAMRDKDCGLWDNFYNKCGGKNDPDAPASPEE